MKCISCNSKKIKTMISDFNTKATDFRGDLIFVKSVESFKCEVCEETWISPLELKRIQTTIEKNQNEVLSPELIKMIRESLPISSKQDLSAFLCLNEKAFVKWEKGYTELNRAYDLLIRLIARSQDNFNFVQELHNKKFKFDPKDYHFTKKNKSKFNVIENGSRSDAR